MSSRLHVAQITSLNEHWRNATTAGDDCWFAAEQKSCVD